MPRERAATATSTATWPPLDQDETDAERAQRLLAEAEAKVISDAIDAKLLEEKEYAREQRRSVGARILLLGQAES